jgi:hypothetical protein
MKNHKVELKKCQGSRQQAIGNIRRQAEAGQAAAMSMVGDDFEIRVYGDTDDLA